MQINIAKDFSDMPGGRLISEGDYSGELFRKELLLPKYKESLEKGEHLIINFDGAYGYPPSFLDEAFGGLVRELKATGILEHIEMIANDDLSVTRRVKNYVEDAERKIRGISK